MTPTLTLTLTLANLDLVIIFFTFSLFFIHFGLFQCSSPAKRGSNNVSFFSFRRGSKHRGRFTVIFFLIHSGAENEKPNPLSVQKTCMCTQTKKYTYECALSTPEKVGPLPDPPECKDPDRDIGYDMVCLARGPGRPLSLCPCGLVASQSQPPSTRSRGSPQGQGRKQPEGHTSSPRRPGKPEDSNPPSSEKTQTKVAKRRD